MPKIEPIYIFSECNFAFQLRWGLTIFWQKSIHEKHWFTLVIENKSVDLSRAKHAQGGIYWYNLHLALVHFERWRCANRELLIATQDVMVGTCAKKGWQLSRLAIVPDHFHLAIGCSLDESPSDVVLSLMNNIAWVHGMKPVLCHSAFMGTFGEYDQRSVVGRQRGEF